MLINNLNPVAFEIFFIKIHWYSLAYIFGIISGWIYIKKILIKNNIHKIYLDDLIAYLIVGIIIEDDGPSIPKSEYSNVFKPFYKINKGRGDSKSSVGLGLSIASDVVRSHGGKIDLNKSKLGGLSVKISLPF